MKLDNGLQQRLIFLIGIIKKSKHILIIRLASFLNMDLK